MSTVKSKKLQVGTDASASNNFTIYQPSTPDGTLRIGVGNADSPTEVARFDATGMISGAPTPSALSTATGSAPSYSARAWVNFNGTGTVAIRDSGNVSSITDNGTGKFTVNFTTAMPDINYSMHIDSMPTYNWTGDVNSNMRIEDMTTTNCRFGSAYNTGTVRYDNTANCVTIFR